jgi:hypothetical protein
LLLAGLPLDHLKRLSRIWLHLQAGIQNIQLLK